jgi:hypothetical protein
VSTHAIICASFPSKSGALYFYYLCRGRQEHRCDLPYLPVAKVEQAVLAHYTTVRLSVDFRERAKRLIDEAAATKQATRTQYRDHLTKRLTELAVKEDHYLDLVGDPDWPKDKLSARMRSIRDEHAQIEQKLAQTKGELEIGRQTLLSAMDLLDNPQALYAEARIPAKRVLNRAIFTKLYLDDLGEGPRVMGDELAEPFVTLVWARRANEGSITLPELRQATRQALSAAEESTQPMIPPTNTRGSLLTETASGVDPPSLAEMLNTALAGRCSSMAMVVGRRLRHTNRCTTVMACGFSLPLVRERRSPGVVAIE